MPETESAIVENRAVLIALVSAMFAVALGVGFILPLLPVYAEDLGASGLWIGLIFGANPLARAFLMMLFASLSDRFGKKLFMAVGLSGYLLVSLGFVMAATPLHLFLMRILQGAFSGMVIPVARAYAGELSRRGREGSVMGYMSLGFFAGHAGGPVMGGLIADHMGIESVFYFMGALSAVALGTILLYVPERVSGRLRKDSSEPAPTALEMLRSDVVKGIITIRGSVALGRGIYATLLPLFGQVVVGLTATQVGILVSLRALVASVLQPVFGLLADRYNRKYLAITGFLLAPVGLLLVSLSGSFMHLLALSVFMGLSTGISVPSATAIAVEEGRIFGMGTMMGLLALGQSLSMSGGAFLGGVLLDTAGPRGSFQVAALLTASGILLASHWLKAYRQTTARVG